MSNGTPSGIRSTAWEQSSRGTDRFFEPAALFESVRAKVLPALRGAEHGGPLRVWVPGCASGVDVYAYAIELLELLQGSWAHLQVFGTDQDADAIATARAGWYREEQLRSVSAPLRERYFGRVAGGYQVQQQLRRCCALARHDLEHDPPFSRLDLVCCRDLLARLDPGTHDQILSTLHYALRPSGFLLLGQDDDLCGFEHLFARVEGSRRIYRRLQGTSELYVSGELGRLQVRIRPQARRHEPPNEAAQLDSSRRLDRLLAHRYAPPCWLLGENMDLIQQRGETRVRVRVDGVELDALTALRGPLAANLRGAFRTASATGQLVRADALTLVMEDGQLLTRELVVISLASSEGAPQFAVTLEPAAALAEHEPELARTSIDLFNVFSGSSTPMLVLDARRRIRHFSANARRLLSVIDADVGRALEDLRLNVDAPLEQYVTQVLASAQPHESEVQGSDGCWHRLQIRPFTAENGQLDGVVISLLDIDAFKHLVSQAQLASREAEQASRAKDDFMATLSHELRSPLHGMLVYAQLLQRGTVDAQRLREASEAIETGVMQMVQLIDELLDMSRIMHGKLELARAPMDLVTLVAQALQGVAEKCARKPLRLVVDLPTSAPVSGDASRLRQVVTNLLSNAIKFTADGGVIKVSLKLVDGRAELRVQDDGVGIEAGFLPKLFDRFTQANSTLTRQFGGLGLGLNIVRNLVELHDGSVSAHSAGPGRGATFTVSLPLETALPAAVVPVRRSHEPAALHGLRILVVDDDHVARRAIAQMLSQAGAEVLSAPSAADAMEAIVECSPALLLCDIAMPEEDGWSLIRRVRALEDAAQANIPALALSAYARAEDREHSLQAGYQKHLAKPVDIQVLTDALLDLSASHPEPTHVRARPTRTRTSATHTRASRR